MDSERHEIGMALYDGQLYLVISWLRIELTMEVIAVERDGGWMCD